MSSTSLAATATSARQQAAQTDDLVKTWRERITRAKEARRPHERTWLSNLAFAAGQMWLVWDNQAGKLRHLQEMDPRQAGRTLYTANRIREYLQAQLGELTSDDSRQDLVTAQDGDDAEAVARELNAAVEHVWRHEAKAEHALERARRATLTMGVSAIRAKYDASKGPVVDRQPVDQQGNAVTDEETLAALEAQGTLPDGSLPKFKQIRDGYTCLEVYTAFQILTPPGVVHEDDFPWEILVRPVLIDDLIDEYGDKAAGLVEDTDIASAAGLSTSQSVSGAATTGANTGTGRLRDHVWLYTGFAKPSRRHPNGQKVVIASNQYRLLEQGDLEYKLADGTPDSGVVYLHWWRLDDRAQSQSFIEPMKDPQRLINERKTQNAEIIERGLPKVFMQESSVPEAPYGHALEMVKMPDGATEPHFFNGIGPGPWMYQDIEALTEDLSHASTLSPIRTGENPAGVDTYSQFVALNENEGKKRDAVLTDHRRQTAKLLEFIVHDIRTWWPEEKTILVSGDEDGVAQQTFRKSRVPDFFMVKQAEGPARARSEAAEIQKVDAIWGAAVASLLVQQDPDGWTRWYADSLKAGQALELPEPQKDSQERFAEFENFLMANGEEVQPAYYDLAPVHIVAHREAQDDARARGDLETVARIEQHVQATLEIQREVAQRQAALEAPAQAQQMMEQQTAAQDQQAQQTQHAIAVKQAPQPPPAGGSQSSS